MTSFLASSRLAVSERSRRWTAVKCAIAVPLLYQALLILARLEVDYLRLLVVVGVVAWPMRWQRHSTKGSRKLALVVSSCFYGYSESN